MMRSLFKLLVLVALLFAPLAAPAAMAARSAAECQDMGMGGGVNHEMPAGDHSGSATCCLAVCSAIAMPSGAIDRSALVGHLAYQPLYESFRLGAGPSTDDPPPRRA